MVSVIGPNCRIPICKTSLSSDYKFVFIKTFRDFVKIFTRRLRLYLVTLPLKKKIIPIFGIPFFFNSFTE